MHVPDTRISAISDIFDKSNNSTTFILFNVFIFFFFIDTKILCYNFMNKLFSTFLSTKFLKVFKKAENIE